MPRFTKCNACLIYDEINKSRNHLVLSEDRIYRLIGISEDPSDWYYMLEDMHGDLSYMTCVAGFIDIFPLIPKDRYTYLDHSFILNKKPPRGPVMQDISPNLPARCFCDQIRAKLKKNDKDEKAKRINEDFIRNSRTP
jgi:hypothetical protein